MTSSSRSNASPSSNAPAATHLPPPHAWQASALRDDANWKQRLSPEASKGFRDAVLRALDTGKDLLDLTQDDFPLNAAALRLIWRSNVSSDASRSACDRAQCCVMLFNSVWPAGRPGLSDSDKA